MAGKDPLSLMVYRLQVAAKYMPVASIKIGVDLDKIKPIKGCITFQEDITTPRCVQLVSPSSD